MKIILSLAIVSLLAGTTVFAHTLTTSEIVGEGEDAIEVITEVAHSHPGNGMPMCKLDNSCPCMGLQGNFLTACEVQYAPTTEKVGGTVEEQIISLQIKLIGLLKQLISLL